MWFHPNLLKEQFWPLWSEGAVDEEKASKGQLRYTLFVWWCVPVCVRAPLSAPECMCVCVSLSSRVQVIYSSWCVFRQTHSIHPVQDWSSVHNDIRAGSSLIVVSIDESKKSPSSLCRPERERRRRLRGRGCGYVSVTECGAPVAEKGGARAAGGWREGLGVRQEVAWERRGGWVAGGTEGVAATGCRRACAGAAGM